jgi:hypothetical protein
MMRHVESVDADESPPIYGFEGTDMANLVGAATLAAQDETTSFVLQGAALVIIGVLCLMIVFGQISDARRWRREREQRDGPPSSFSE